MQWRRTRSDGGLDLYVEEAGTWKHYTQSILRQPDLRMKGASEGYTTMQACLKAGYKYLEVSKDD